MAIIWQGWQRKMDKMLNAFITRRSLLKLGAISGAFLAVPLWNLKAEAQPTANVVSGIVGAKPDGLVSFNAGWAIPLEDKPALLALEEKKIKEAQAALPAEGLSNNSGTDATAKSAKKSWGDKVQEVWNKVKNFF